SSHHPSHLSLSLPFFFFHSSGPPRPLPSSPTRRSSDLGQSRVFYSMARDGLLPPLVNKVHPKFHTPYITSIVTGVAVAFFAAILPIGDAANLVSIGTLLAFVIVSAGVMVLRYREPNLQRAFRTPAVYVVAPLGALSALYLMISLPLTTWIRLAVWFVIGIVIYALYGYRNSNLQGGTPVPAAGD